LEPLKYQKMFVYLCEINTGSAGRRKKSVAVRISPSLQSAKRIL
jgi:hypothetical protein